jgi:hypothetical protein
MVKHQWCKFPDDLKEGHLRNLQEFIKTTGTSISINFLKPHIFKATILFIFYNSSVLHEHYSQICIDDKYENISICICVYMCTCIYTCIYVETVICIYTCIYTYTYGESQKLL